MILRTLFCILSLSCLSLSAHASFALRGKSFTPKCKKQGRKEFKINKGLQVNSEPTLTTEDVAAIVPTDMQTTNDGNSVRDRILQNSATAFFNSSMMKNTFLMKTAKKVESSTKMDMAVKEKAKVAGEEETEHKFKFDVQALKTEAKFIYQGYIDSKVQYNAGNDSLLVSIEEKLSDNSKIALSHTKDREQSRQLLQYEISW